MANPINLATLFREQIGGRRNLIINGAMQVAQRGVSEPNITADGYYTADRLKTGINGLGTWTQSVENDGPDGFSKSLKMLCTSAAASPAAGNFLLLTYRFEGQDLQHLKKGTSSAESVTLSFWVKSNKTGTYTAELMDNDNSLRHIGKSFTVNSSGTWEYKTVTFEGDTTGAFDNDNNLSLYLDFWLAGGSNFTGGTLQTSWGSYVAANRAAGNVNLGDTTNNYFQITGVQLEVGETATPFEHRSYGEELALCQRYYCEFDLPSDYSPGGGGSGLYRAYALPVTMRASPTGSIITPCQYLSGASSTSTNYSPTVSANLNFANLNQFSGLSNATGVWSGRIALDAEL